MSAIEWEAGDASAKAVDTLARLFRAENDRDWEAYRAFLHPDVVWHLHGEEDRTIQGVEEYLRTIRDAYAVSDAHFHVEEAHEATDGRRVVALLVDDFGRRLFEVFDVEEGRWGRWDEFAWFTRPICSGRYPMCGGSSPMRTSLFPTTLPPVLYRQWR